MRDRVVEMKEEIESLKKDYEGNTFALDLLRELKAQSIRQDEINKNIIKRQHITIIILIAVIVSMIIGFFIFANQFEVVGEETTVDGGDGTATYLENSNAGDINYGEDN
jgi:hypothetical protein